MKKMIPSLQNTRERDEKQEPVARSYHSLMIITVKKSIKVQTECEVDENQT